MITEYSFGYITALTLCEYREIVQMTYDSVEECQNDSEANRTGRFGAIFKCDMSCREICKKYRPSGLDEIGWE